MQYTEWQKNYFGGKKGHGSIHSSVEYCLPCQETSTNEILDESFDHTFSSRKAGMRYENPKIKKLIISYLRVPPLLLCKIKHIAAAIVQSTNAVDPKPI